MYICGVDIESIYGFILLNACRLFLLVPLTQQHHGNSSVSPSGRAEWRRAAVGGGASHIPVAFNFFAQCRTS